jgi:ATP-dependent helicase/nuclease subunit A
MRPIKPEDIVILLRAPNTMGGYHKLALEQRGIRCAFGGGGDLLRTKEITALRSLLRAIHNPQQDIPLVAALSSPLFCLTADNLATIRQQHKSRSIFDALKTQEDDKFKKILELLYTFRNEARVRTLSELLETVYVKTNIDSIFGTMEGGAERVTNLESFYQLAIDFEARGSRDLGRFLEYLDSLEAKGVLSGAEPSAEGCVTIMSIHKSKGLEFPVVFLCGLSHGFNKESSRAQVLCDKELCIGASTADATRRVRYPTISKRGILAKMEADALSEELRILYVAMTRAKDRLIMTYASNNLQGDLQDLVSRMNMGCDELLIQEADCLGIWVLLAALKRTEASALFALGGYPSTTGSFEHPWLIDVVQPEAGAYNITQPEVQSVLAGGLYERMAQGLRYQYPHVEATEAPSKQTATQRKGRIKDQEAAENAQEPKHIYRAWRKPTFACNISTEIDPLAYGNALHKLLEYIDYQKCDSIGSLKEQLEELTEQGRLTREQASLVDCDALWEFFESSIGQRLRNADHVLREFKFSILDDGTSYGEGLEGEKILLQGVVDCAILDDDGITVIDFKTDRITDADLDSKVQNYKYQVEAYADALSRIFEKPIKRSCLYFFRLNRCVDL